MDSICWCIVALTATVAGFGLLILRRLDDLANLVDGTPGWPQVDQITRLLRAYDDGCPKFSCTTTTKEPRSETLTLPKGYKLPTTKPAKAGKGRKT